MTLLMPKLETADNFSSYCVFLRFWHLFWNMWKSHLSLSWKSKHPSVLIFKLFCSKGLKTTSVALISLYTYHVTFRNYCLWIIVYILTLSAQRYFCKNVNHSNLFCVLFVEDIPYEKSKLSNRTGVGPNWAGHMFPYFCISVCFRW